MEVDKMEGFRTTMKDVPQYIDWNSFNIENINGSTVIIYAHDLEKDVPIFQELYLFLVWILIIFNSTLHNSIMSDFNSNK